MYLCLMKNTGSAVMGMTVSTVGVIVHVVLNAALIYNWLNTREHVARQRNRFTGAIYILLGMFAALTGSSSAQSR